MRGLRGLRVLVTGAAGGIGSAIVERLATEGARVVGTDRRSPPGPSAAELFLLADAVREEEVDDAVAQAARALGGLDGLVSAAGVEAHGPTHELGVQEFRAVLEANLVSTFLVLRAALRLMVPSGGGRIVTLGSTASVRAAPGLAAYAASKGGVLALTRAVAVEYARAGIRANCLCPGGTRTPLLAAIDAGRAGPDAFLARHPVGRYAEPAEIAAAAAYLLSDDASFVLGATFLADGGYSCA